MWSSLHIGVRLCRTPVCKTTPRPSKEGLNYYLHTINRLSPTYNVGGLEPLGCKYALVKGILQLAWHINFMEMSATGTNEVQSYILNYQLKALVSILFQIPNILRVFQFPWRKLHLELT